MPVLRGGEVVFRVRRLDGDTIPNRVPVRLEVQLAPGQEAADVHAEGWYVSAAQMSRIFELLKSPSDDE